MKNAKKLLSLVLVLVLALVFAACGKDEKSEVGNDGKIKEAREVVDNFTNAFTSYDIEGMKECIHGEDAFEFLNEFEEKFTQLGSKFVSETNGAISEEKANKYVKEIIEEIFSNVKMETGEGKTDGNKVKFQIKMDVPDFEAIDMSELQNPDDAMMMKILGIDINNPSTMEELETLSPEEIMDRAVEGMIDWVVEKIKDADTKEQDGSITVEKIGEDWKITDIDD